MLSPRLISAPAARSRHNAPLGRRSSAAPPSCDQRGLDRGVQVKAHRERRARVARSACPRRADRRHRRRGTVRARRSGRSAGDSRHGWPRSIGGRSSSARSQRTVAGARPSEPSSRISTALVSATTSTECAALERATRRQAGLGAAIAAAIDDDALAPVAHLERQRAGMGMLVEAGRRRLAGIDQHQAVPGLQPLKAGMSAPAPARGPWSPTGSAPDRRGPRPPRSSC